MSLSAVICLCTYLNIVETCLRAQSDSKKHNKSILLGFFYHNVLQFNTCLIKSNHILRRWMIGPMKKYGRETVCFWICSWYIPLYSSLACELRSITELQLRINQSRKRKHKKFFSSDACPLFRRKYKSVLNFVNFILSWKMHFVKKNFILLMKWSKYI